MEIAEKILKAHQKFGVTGVFIISCFYAVQKLFAKKSEMAIGWKAPASNSIMKSICGDSHRSIQFNDLSARKSRSFKEDQSKDTYPLT